MESTSFDELNIKFKTLSRSITSGCGRLYHGLLSSATHSGYRDIFFRCCIVASDTTVIPFATNATTRA